jgi:hypothetical protein
MSVAKFELTEKHISLVKGLEWNINNMVINGFFSNPEDNGNLYDDMGVILYGVPEITDATQEQNRLFTPEQFDEMNKLYEELPTALSIILYTGKFEVGTYKTKTYIKDWKKI